MHLRKLRLLLLLCAIGFVACSDPPDLILKNATVVDMVNPEITYQAIGIKDGIITRIGSYDHVAQYANSHTKEVDCKGKFIFPGFIDAHAHIGQYAMTYSAAVLYGAPYGNINTIQALKDAMKAYTQKLYPNPGDSACVLGNGYDDAILSPHQHPTKKDLDDVSGKHPMYIIHSSGHMGVANTALLHKLGFDKKGITIEGGTIVQGSDGPTGLLMENANIAALGYMLGQMKIPPDSLMKGLIKAEQEWFSYGVTTICEGRADPNTIALIQQASAQNKIKGDIIVMADFDLNRYRLKELSKIYNQYDANHHFKLGGIKFTFDGSPQGRSAAFRDPYLHPPIGQKPGFKGNLIYPDSAGYFLASVFKAGMQVHIHVNGDTAIGQALYLLDSLKDEIPSGAKNVLVHVQTARRDQVAKLAKAKGYLRPSWFPTHTYIWGRWHIDTTLGHPRADSISPIKMGMDMGINNFTIHTDAPVTPPDLLTAVYAAVNRKTMISPQVVMAPNLVIPIWDAMKAITVNGAEQWGEESTGKGVLKPTGIADMVILDRNPLTSDKASINTIKVLRTYKNGQLVYSAPNDPIAK